MVDCIDRPTMDRSGYPQPPLLLCFSFVSFYFLQTCNWRVSGVSSEILFSGVSSFSSPRRSFECRSSSLKVICISLDELKTLVSPCGHFIVHIVNGSDIFFLGLEGSNISAICLCLERKVVKHSNQWQQNVKVLNKLI